MVPPASSPGRSARMPKAELLRILPMRSLSRVARSAACLLVLVGCSADGEPPRDSPGSGRESATPRDCAVLEVRFADAHTASARFTHPGCDGLGMRLSGPPVPRADPPGIYTLGRTWDIPLELRRRGAGGTSGELRLDSVNLVQRGRLLPSRASRTEHVGYEPWHGRPRIFSGAPDTLTLWVHPLVQGLRISFTAEPEGPRRAAIENRPYRDTLPVDPVVKSFVLHHDLPQLRGIHAVIRDSAARLLLFQASYGEGQDCPSGCFHATATGLRLGDRIGWIGEDQGPDQAAERVRQNWFRLSPADTALFSTELLDRLCARLGPYHHVLSQQLAPLVLRDRAVPRAMIRHLALPALRGAECVPPGLTVAAAAADSDVGLLTRFAIRTGGAQGQAVEALRSMAPRLVEDPATPEATLFVLAQAVAGSVGGSEGNLARRIAEHPNGRRSIPILAVLSLGNPDLATRLPSLVRGSEEARGRLAAYLAANPSGVESAEGRALLDDPETGSNPDVLLALANLPVAGDQEVVFAASRRLPASALRRWEPLDACIECIPLDPIR